MNELILGVADVNYRATGNEDRAEFLDDRLDQWVLTAWGESNLFAVWQCDGHAC